MRWRLANKLFRLRRHQHAGSPINMSGEDAIPRALTFRLLPRTHRATTGAIVSACGLIKARHWRSLGTPAQKLAPTGIDKPSNHNLPLRVISHLLPGRHLRPANYVSIRTKVPS
jgi:hypothetical protein